MARIRSIHPSLLTDEAFMTLTVDAPLAVTLLIGLWTEADDQGVFEWKPLTMKARILPAPVVDIAPLLEVLVVNRFIRRFEIDGRIYGAVRNFTRFQRPKKPNAIHPMTEEVRAWVGTGSVPVGNRFRTGGEKSPQMEDGGGRKEGKEEGGKGNHTDDPSLPRERARGDASREYAFVGRVVRLSKADFDRWSSAYRHLELTAELIARDAYLAGPEVNDRDRKNWFTSTSKYLANRNAELANRARAGPDKLPRGYAI